MKNRMPFAILVLCICVPALLVHRFHQSMLPQSQSTLPVPIPRAVRPPTAEWSGADRHELTRALDQAFAPVLHSQQNGFVVLTADGTLLYDRNGGKALTPASTLKVLTAATTLARLGPDYRFTTRIASLVTPTNGIVNGDVYFIGGGDPVLTSEDLRAGILQLRAQGVREIHGRVVIDASAFSRPEQNPHWPSDDRNLDYGAGTSAFSLDEDVAVFHVQPTVPGQAAKVRLEPADPTAQIEGALTTAPAGSDPTAHIDHVEGSTTFSLSGGIAVGEEQQFPIPVGNVPEYVAGVCTGLLHAAGIQVAALPQVDVAPLGAQTLWLHRSPPLKAIVRHMLIVSDNHVAEQLLRTVASAEGHLGTERAGIAVERAFLASLGVRDTGLRLFDGSGLAPEDRIAPLSLATIIADAAARPGSPLLDGLPRVGIEGTVRGHTLHAAFGRVRAKSGHITGVDGLAGVVQSRHHGAIAFAFLANDADDGTVEDAEDAVFDRLSQF